jgi:hypothetical protein
MAVDPPARLLLIVTGSTLRAEELDRPLAYYLKQQIERLLHEIGPPLGHLQIRVVADWRGFHDRWLQSMPTISVGGPGVNALAHYWLEAVPVSLAVEDQYYIQMDHDLEESHASVWGINNSTTQIAVSVFLDRFLPRLLEHCASITRNHSDRDEIK